MTITKHICLLGFSKQAELVIKSGLQQQYPKFGYEWVSANARPLDGVIINALFLDSPQIQKYIAAIKHPCVAIHSRQEEKLKADNHKIISIPLQTPMLFDTTWLDTLFENKQKSAPVHNAPPSQNGTEYRALIELIKQRSPVFIAATCGDKTAYLAPKEQNAYIDFARNQIPGIEHWQWSQIPSLPLNDTMRRINIDQWLFETIWQSNSDDFTVDSSMFYKLIRWPQPFSQHRRSEALRLAAQIKFHPVKVTDLAEKTQFSPDLISQFLYATNQAGQIEAIPATSPLVAESNQEAPRKADPDREIKKSFIGRLRAKLGL